MMNRLLMGNSSKSDRKEASQILTAFELVQLILGFVFSKRPKNKKTD